MSIKIAFFRVMDKRCSVNENEDNQKNKNQKQLNRKDG